MQSVECSNARSFPPSIRTTLKEATSGRMTLRLLHATPGYEIAGSMARLREHTAYLYQYEMADGSIGGQWFKHLEDARERFDYCVAQRAAMLAEMEG